MDAEQEEPPRNSAWRAIRSSFHRTSERLGSWKLEIASFVCGLVVLVILLAVLSNLDYRARPLYENHNPHVEIGILLLLLYVFLMIPTSSGVRRIVQIHTAHPPRLAILESSNEKAQQCVYAVKAFFTSRTFGIAPAPVLALLVAATATIGPWTLATLHQRTLRLPVDIGGWLPIPSVPVAHNLKSDPSGSSDTRHEELLLSALHRGLAGDISRDFVPYVSCAYAYYGSITECTWDKFATIETRSQCTKVTEHLEMSDSYSVFQALRNVTSLPPYNPLDETRARVPSPSIMSLKNTTFVTLSNIQSHTGSWKTEGYAPDLHQISQSALNKLGKFSSIVVNPVGKALVKHPAFNQTSGTLQNFHIIYAELGISGHFDELGGRLNWVDLKRGMTAAWECSLDTVVRRKSAFYRDNVYTEYDYSFGNPLLPLGPESPERTNQTFSRSTVLPLKSGERSVNFLWDNKRFSIDNKITSAISDHLEGFYAGSSFDQGWLSTTERGIGSFNATTPSTFFIHNRLSQAVNDWRKSTNKEWGPPWNIDMIFQTAAASLSYLLRHYNGPDRYGNSGGDAAIGELRQDQIYYAVQWGWTSLPILLVVGTSLIMLAAALDERYHRIMLTQSDDADESNET